MSSIFPNKVISAGIGAGIPNSIATWKTVSELIGSSVYIDSNGQMSIGGSSADGMLDITCRAADIVGLKITAAASQTEDLLKIVDDSEDALFIINYQGDTGITVQSPNEPLHVQSDYNGNRAIRMGNESDGTSAVGRFIVDVLGGSTFLAGYGSNFTTSGSKRANSASLIANAGMAGGLSFVSRNTTSGNLRFYTGGNTDAHKRIEIDVNGNTFAGDGGTTNYTKIGLDGTVTLFGDARKYKCVDLTPANLGKPVANPPAIGLYQGFQFDRYDRSTIEQVYYIWHVPNDFAPGDASVRGHFGLFVENPPNTTGDEAVVMGFEYKKIIAETDVFDFSSGTTTGTLTIPIIDGESPYEWHSSPTGSCTTTGWNKEDIILFRFFRDATNPNDTYDNEVVAADNDAWIGVYHLEYLKDSFGGA